MKTEIDKDLIKRFDEWCEININYIKSHKGEFTTTALLIDREDKTTIMMLMFRNSQEKQIMKTGLKLFALSQNVKGYFWASDTRVTVMTKEGKAKVYDGLVQMLCSPKGSLHRMLLHNGKGIKIKVKEMPEDSMEQFNIQSEWDVFGSPVDMSKEAIDEYEKFKKENPKLYKEVA